MGLDLRHVSMSVLESEGCPRRLQMLGAWIFVMAAYDYTVHAAETK